MEQEADAAAALESDIGGIHESDDDVGEQSNDSEDAVGAAADDSDVELGSTSQQVCRRDQMATCICSCVCVWYSRDDECAGLCAGSGSVG